MVLNVKAIFKCLLHHEFFLRENCGPTYRTWEQYVVNFRQCGMLWNNAHVQHRCTSRSALCTSGDSWHILFVCLVAKKVIGAIKAALLLEFLFCLTLNTRGLWCTVPEMHIGHVASETQKVHGYFILFPLLKSWKRKLTSTIFFCEWICCKRKCSDPCGQLHPYWHCKWRLHKADWRQFSSCFLWSTVWLFFMPKAKRVRAYGYSAVIFQAAYHYFFRGVEPVVEETTFFLFQLISCSWQNSFRFCYPLPFPCTWQKVQISSSQAWDW